MPVNSKQKGARFERLLANKFKEHGFLDARRTAQYCGNTGDASDVVGLPQIHVEAKHQEKMELYKWMKQAEHDCTESQKEGKETENKEEKMPAVFHKQNGKEILVTMSFDDWMKIYEGFLKSQT